MSEFASLTRGTLKVRAVKHYGHLWLDLFGVFEGKPVGFAISLSTLADYNFTEPQFYLENLAHLIRDGWVELTDQN